MIAILDPTHNRITRIGEDGSVAGTRALTAEGVNPFNEPVCAPDGGLVYTPRWGWGWRDRWPPGCATTT